MGTAFYQPFNRLTPIGQKDLAMAHITNLHAIQSIPASLINRDENGNAKGITIGNVRRDRVSSQSWKRATRISMRTEIIDDGVWANRTNRLPHLIVTELINQHHHDPNAADQAVNVIFNAIKLKRKDNGNTAASIFAATTAVNDLAQLISDNFATLTSGEKPHNQLIKAAIATLDVNGAIDLALFGRMLAEIPASRIDGAAGFSHAFGITPTTTELDFFTAVDDCATESEPQSSNLGLTDLTAPVLYRHAYLDHGQLAHNLSSTPNLISPAIDSFIRHTALSIPTAKSRSAAAHTRPEILVATIGHHALSAANAYTQPIVSENVISDAITALFAQLDYNTKLEPHTTITLPLSVTADNACQSAKIATVDSLDNFLSAIKDVNND